MAIMFILDKKITYLNEACEKVEPSKGFEEVSLTHSLFF